MYNLSYLNNSRPSDKSDGDIVKVNFDSPKQWQNLLSSDEIQSSPSQATNLLNEGILAGQRIAKISVTLIGMSTGN